MDPSKCTFIADAEGRAKAYRPEELMALGLNHWSGWHCAAGVEHIFIDSDGYFSVAACNEGGRQGNIYQPGNRERLEWVQCKRKMCFCGADMRLRKVKSKEDIAKIVALDPTQLKFQDNPVSTPSMVGKIWEQEFPLSMNWDMGRRCNFDCSYCHPDIHNAHDPHHDWEKLELAVTELERFFWRGRRAKIAFTGGEPTLNPHYLKLVSRLKGMGHHVHTQTNGSRLPQYYEELLRDSLMGISLHLEFLKIDRFTQTLRHLLHLKMTKPEYRWQWIGIRIMSAPGRVHECVRLKESLMALPGADEHLNQVVLAPLYDRTTSTQVQPYPPGELDLIIQHG